MPATTRTAQNRAFAELAAAMLRRQKGAGWLRIGKPDERTSVLTEIGRCEHPEFMMALAGVVCRAKLANTRLAVLYARRLRLNPEHENFLPPDLTEVFVRYLKSVRRSQRQHSWKAILWAMDLAVLHIRNDLTFQDTRP